MPKDPQIVADYWKPSFDTYYDAYYQELAYQAVSDKVQIIDIVTKALVATTATGSAIAGLSLWNDPVWKPAWLVLAATAAMASIISGAMDVPTRLKDYEGFFKLFSALRIDTDTFRKQLYIGINPVDVQQKYSDLRQRLSDAMSKSKPDLIFSKRMWNSIQDQLDSMLSADGTLKRAPLQSSDGAKS